MEERRCSYKKEKFFQIKELYFYGLSDYFEEYKNDY